MADRPRPPVPLSDQEWAELLARHDLPRPPAPATAEVAPVPVGVAPWVS
jgi:hypothetical protein